ncbi:MAG: hypothetical protein HY673_02730 [Chloroflexi bacterium]|nr:hypothetical protein [Chloroflexota bacterium]
MTTNARAIERASELARARRIAPAHPLMGRVAKGGHGYAMSGARLAGGAVTYPGERRVGVVATGFLIVVAILMMLWVLGFGLSAIGYFIMNGA